MTYRTPQPSKLSKESISHLAEKFSARVGYEAGCDLESLILKLGGKLEYQDFWELEESDSGSITVEPDNSFTVYLANHTSIARDRFTVAHELGHLVLHFLLPKATDPTGDWGLKASRFGTGITETEANQFAASFLMPEKQFREVHERFGCDIVETADYFGVSFSAASVRAAALGFE